MTGLSSSSVSVIVARLVRRKLISEEPFKDYSRVGRRPTALRLCTDSMMAIGVEVTLAGARIVLSDLVGTFVRQKQVPWHPSYDVFLTRVHQGLYSIAQAVPSERLLGVGVTLPGLIEPETGKVVAAENFGWIGIEAGRLLRGRLSWPFYFENTPRLAALAEVWFSSPTTRVLRDFVFVSVRDGVGTGVIINGQVFGGARSAASDFGHTVLYPDGVKCKCGNWGCWEQYASDFAFRRRYLEKSGLEVETEIILQKAREGDPIALEALRETAQHVALGFGNLIVAFNPEALIVDGYLAAGWDLVEETIWCILRSRVPHYYLTGLAISPSAHAKDVLAKGACALVFAKFFTSFENFNSGVNSRMVGSL